MPPGTLSSSEIAKPVSVNRQSGRKTRGKSFLNEFERWSSISSAGLP